MWIWMYNEQDSLTSLWQIDLPLKSLFKKNSLRGHVISLVKEGYLFESISSSSHPLLVVLIFMISITRNNQEHVFLLKTLNGSSFTNSKNVNYSVICLLLKREHDSCFLQVKYCRECKLTSRYIRRADWQWSYGSLLLRHLFLIPVSHKISGYLYPCKRSFFFICVSLFVEYISNIHSLKHTHTHTHTQTYIYIYIYICCNALIHVRSL